MVSIITKKRFLFLLALCIGSTQPAAFADDAVDLASEIAGRRAALSTQLETVANQHVKLGKEYYSVGEYDRALSEFNRALELVPNHEEADSFKLRTIEAVAGGGRSGTGPAIMPTDVVNQERWGAMMAYNQGVESFKAGKQDDAMRKFQTSLQLDPNYVPAKRFVMRLLRLQKESLDRDHDILQTTMINEVKAKWLPEGGVSGLGVMDQEEYKMMTEEKQQMLRKIQQVIPEINFTQARLRDVLQYLSKITGVNIILDERVFEGDFTPVYTRPRAFVDDTEEDLDQPASRTVSDTVTISLTNIPLIEALKYILKIKGLKYRIDDFAIMVSTPEAIGDEEMETRFYQLSSGMGEFVDFSPKDTGGMGSGSERVFGSVDSGERTTIKDVLAHSGVPFPPGSSVFLDRRSGTLITHNTPENLSMVEALLKIIDKPPFQVSIESRFVKIGQNDLEELGFNWTLDSAARIGSKRGFDPITGQRVNRMQIGSGHTQEVFSPGALVTTGDEWIPPNPLHRDGSFYSPPVGYRATGGSNTYEWEVERSDGTFKQETVTAPRVGYEVGTKATPSNAVLGALNTVATVADLPPINPALPGLLPQSGLFALQGILTKPQFSMILHALDRSGNTSLLSAPRVTTVNNQQAQIELVEEIIYPGEYDVQPAVFSDIGFSEAVVVPGDFQTREVGIILNVTPSVGSDRKTITLTLIPEISSLDRFLDWGNQRSGLITTPVFKTTNVSTTVIVGDGETVVLGGLIEEQKITVKDKYPLLGDLPFIGRLFRHDLEQSEKLNMIIFVTARLIDAHGEDLNRTRAA